MKDEYKGIGSDLVKSLVLKEFEYLDMVAKDIVNHNGCEDIQLYVKNELPIDIESPLESIGGTDCEWIRLSYGGIWIFLDADDKEWNNNDNFTLNGKVEYQIDYACEYGGEFYTSPDRENYIECIKSLTEDECEKLLDTVPFDYDTPKEIKKQIEGWIEGAIRRISEYVPFDERLEKVHEKEDLGEER